MNGSCLDNCTAPFTQNNISIGVICIAPLEPADFILINDTMQTAIITTVAITAPLLLLGGDPYTTVNSYTSIQSLHFALYYNVNYLKVLHGLLKSMGTVSIAKFLPNPIKWFTELPVQSAPKNFKDAGYQGLQRP
jgi:hypothetical protein